MNRLEGKKVIILGGASDMARATTKLMLKEGAELYLIDCAEEKLLSFKEELSQNGHKVHTYVADATVPEQIESAVREAHKLMGRIDILVNIAGIIRHASIMDMSYEDWNRVIQVNLTGYFISCKNVVPYMVEQHYGRIVNISSISGRTGRPGCGCNYSASKAGVIGLTKNLARGLAEYGITINALAPGPLKGSMFDSMTPDRQKNLSAGIPLGDLGEMEDVAYAILYLASDESSYVTGAVLDINGGVYI